jgi:release factor glutamine methyltransferase
MGLTIKELIPIGERILKESGIENANHDAEALLGFEIGFDKQKIFMNWVYEVDDLRSERYFDLVNRRAGGEPLQYITGEQWFMGHRFSVDPSVLIIRPETELLAEKAIDYLQTHERAKDVLDLCTGSGALAISIAKACPRIRITASDISSQALAVAKKNARDLGVSSRLDFVTSDLFDGIKSGAFGKKFDLIVTNPPYIRTSDLENLQKEIREHEPKIALDGGTDGLDFYRRIAKEAGPYLKPGACILTEIGYAQASDVSALFGEAGFSGIEVFPDLSGLDRIIKLF